MIPLTEKYRPRTLAEIVGQPDVVEQLSLFVADPHPVAFSFEGETGTGKTSAALALAAALGVDVEEGGFGGFYTIASGEQTGESVRSIMAGMRNTPWSGSGWKLLVVNEADAMTPGASIIWLDALEDLPAKTVVVFTTNNPHKIPARLRDRCERLHFESGGLILLPYLQELVDRVWTAETNEPDAPDLGDFGPVQDDRGNVSVRRLLQLMAPWVRAKRRPPCTTTPAAAPSGEQATRLTRSPRPSAGASQPDWQAVGRRYLAGESSSALAKEHGLPETTLRGRLNRMGFRRTGKPSL